jgi:hypothetical protein
LLEYRKEKAGGEEKHKQIKALEKKAYIRINALSDKLQSALVRTYNFEQEQTGVFEIDADKRVADKRMADKRVAALENKLWSHLETLEKSEGHIGAHPYQGRYGLDDPESPDKLAWYYSNIKPLRESESMVPSSGLQKSEKTTHLLGALGTMTENWRGKKIGIGYNLVEVQSDIRDWMTKSGQSPWDNEEARKMALTSYLNEAVKKAEAGEITHITIPTPDMIVNRWPHMNKEKAETIYKGALKYIEKVTGQKASVVKMDTETNKYGAPGNFSSETWGIEMTPDVIESIKAQPLKIGLSDFYRKVAFG